MGTRVPIPLGLVRLGEKLPHDVHDRTGNLLLRGGTLIGAQSQIEHLEALGFYDPEAVEWVQALKERHSPEEVKGYVPDRSGPQFDARAELGKACADLQSLFREGAQDFEAGIRAIAATIQRCCALDSDASLSCILIPPPFPDDVRHPVSVAVLVAFLLQRQKHDEARLESALAAALTMNLGAPGLHHGLYYEPGSITTELQARMQAHPKAGTEALLRRGVRDQLWLTVVLQHHELVDGSGYPGALTGERILAESQAVSLADRYCAMVSERAGREAMRPALALREIHALNGKAISAHWVGALVSAVGIYPPGAFVRLANGETAVVARRLIDPKHPVVYSIMDTRGNPLLPPRKRLTASQPQYAIAAPVERAQVNVSMPTADLWPPLQLAGFGKTEVPRPTAA